MKIKANKSYRIHVQDTGFVLYASPNRRRAIVKFLHLASQNSKSLRLVLWTRGALGWEPIITMAVT